MKAALKEAEAAFNRDEVPVGAVVVFNNQIIARAHNLSETLTDATAHAEMQAITAASNYLGGKYLTDCSVYVTLEPCIMCAGALFWSQPARVIYGASDPKRGYSAIGKDLMHPGTIILRGILEDDCGILLKEFFKKKRAKNS